MKAEQTSSFQLCGLALEWRKRRNFRPLIGLIQTDRVRKLIFQVAIHFFSLSVSQQLFIEHRL